MSPLQTLMQGYTAVILVVFIILLLLEILMVICTWILYNKAGQPGWAAIIPIYGTIIKLKVAGKPLSWIGWTIQFIFFMVLNAIAPKFLLTGILYLFSLIAYFVISIMVLNGISKSFGKDAGYTVGLLFLPFIFFPILAFGDSKYIGPGGISNSTNNDSI